MKCLSYGKLQLKWEGRWKQLPLMQPGHIIICMILLLRRLKRMWIGFSRVALLLMVRWTSRCSNLLVVIFYICSLTVCRTKLTKPSLLFKALSSRRWSPSNGFLVPEQRVSNLPNTSRIFPFLSLLWWFQQWVFNICKESILTTR